MSGEHNGAFRATGCTAVDDHGEKIGSITDVIYDVDGEPKYAVIKPGLLRKERIAPLEGAYHSDEDHLVLPLPKDVVLNGPVAPRDHVISAEDVV
jgi:hypothetical protein